MKLVIDIFACIVADAITYSLAAPYFTEAEPTPAARHLDEHPPHLKAAVPSRASIASAPPRMWFAPEAGPTIEDEAAMNTLRNELIRATARDMHQRYEDVMNCLTGIQFAGVEKLRFSVEVVSMPDEATTGPWRFVEIADGEPLPESFAACAARAFGGIQHLRAPKDFHFPRYSGELSMLYTIPPKGD